MKKIELIRSHCNPLLVDDVDTDQIIPARFLKTIGRTGLGAQLFADWRSARFDAASDGRVLLAGNNFGCGSSREHAVWALCDFGFEAVIARSFADIFRANALKNGLIPVAVEAGVHRTLVENPGSEVTIDVTRATLQLAGSEPIAFTLDPFARRCLTNGIDELEYLRRHQTAIAVWEARHG